MTSHPNIGLSHVASVRQDLTAGFTARQFEGNMIACSALTTGYVHLVSKSIGGGHSFIHELGGPFDKEYRPRTLPQRADPIRHLTNAKLASGEDSITMLDFMSRL